MRKADIFLLPGAYRQTGRKVLHNWVSVVDEIEFGRGLRDLKDSILSPGIWCFLSPLLLMMKMMVMTMIMMVDIVNVY